MTERQTLSYLQEKFGQARVQPQPKFGQNFLIDLNLVQMIADTAELDSRDVVLEVGTGMGSLTSLIAEKAAHVVTVEIDHHLAPLAKQEFANFDNITLLEQDALKSKNQLDPALLDVLRSKVAEVEGGRLKLVANLPYNVATPIISNLLYMEPWPARLVATIQKELGDRIVAKPRSKDYGALSIWIQSQCRAEVVRVMPPSVFWPRPKVDSAIVDIRPQKVLRKRIQNRAHFHELVRAIFLHRRKFLRSALISAVKTTLDKSQVDEVLEQLSLDASLRAEQLSPQQMIELAHAVLAAQNNSQPNES